MLSTISYSLASISAKFTLTYISPYAVQLYRTLIQLIFLILCSIPLFFIERNGKIIFSNFFDVINEYKIILLYLCAMTSNCAYGIFIWILIDKFTPNDYGLSMMVENMIDILIQYVSKPHIFKENLIASIIQLLIFLLLIVGICIHNEIIIINKWGFNEYTKKIIAMKGDIDVKESDYLLDESFDENINDEEDIKIELNKL